MSVVCLSFSVAFFGPPGPKDCTLGIPDVQRGPVWSPRKRKKHRIRSGVHPLLFLKHPYHREFDNFGRGSHGGFRVRYGALWGFFSLPRPGPVSKESTTMITKSGIPNEVLASREQAWELKVLTGFDPSIQRGAAGIPSMRFTSEGSSIGGHFLSLS